MAKTLDKDARFTIELDIADDDWLDGSISSLNLHKRVKKDAGKNVVVKCVRLPKPNSGSWPVFSFTATFSHLRKYMWKYSGEQTEGDMEFLDLIAPVRYSQR